MKVQCNKIANIQFLRGYGKKLKAKSLLSSSKSIEQKINNNTPINADFNDNKSLALANFWSYSILKNINTLCGVDTKVCPPQIKVFKREDLIDKTYPDSFCITKPNIILNNAPLFPKRAIFFADNNNSLSELNDTADELYRLRKISSNFFLSTIIHEWIHSLHLYYLSDKKSSTTIGFSPNEKEVIGDILGEYAYNNGTPKPKEVVAEALTQIITSCIGDDNLEMKCSAQDVFESYPDIFQKIVKKSISN